MPAAPAPIQTIFASDNCLSCSSKAFNKPAATTIAVRVDRHEIPEYLIVQLELVLFQNTLEL